MGVRIRAIGGFMLGCEYLWGHSVFVLDLGIVRIFIGKFND